MYTQFAAETSIIKKNMNILLKVSFKAIIINACDLTVFQEVVNGLKEIGHNVTEVGVGSSIVTAVARECDGRIHATSDFRKQGTIAGF